MWSKDSNGTVNIAVGLKGDDSGKYLTANAHAYGLYLDNATLNIYAPINVEQASDPSGSVTYLAKEPITYLKDANFTFNNNDYIYETTGIEPFHNYTARTSALNLQGGNVFTVNTDLFDHKANQLYFSSLDPASTGINYVAVVFDPAILGHKEGHIVGKTDIIKIADTDNKIITGNSQYVMPATNTLTSFTEKTTDVDIALRRYEITPFGVQTEEDAAGSKNVFIGGIDFHTVRPSEPMVTASNMQMSIRNINRFETSTLMRRLGELHRDMPEEDGFWTRFTKGELDVDDCYNSSFDQNYTQFFLGYDKKHDKVAGRFYSGGAVSYTSGDVGYDTGSGSSKSTALSLYQTYIANDGHYWDVVGKFGRVSANYNIAGFPDRTSAAYSTPEFSLSGEYGYRKQYNKGYFFEPQIQLQLSHTNAVNYHMSNDIFVKQNGIDDIIGRIGFLAGKSYNDGSNIYLLASLYDSIVRGNDLLGFYRKDSIRVDTMGNNVWGEFGLGANINIGKTSNLYFDIAKTVGGDVKEKWQINAGLRYAF